MKTIVAMPFAMGHDDPLVVIDAHGLRHGISAKLDGGGHPAIDYPPPTALEPSEVERGSKVSVRLPAGSRAWNRGPLVLGEEVRELLRGYHIFNPHANVRLRAKVTFPRFSSGADHGESDGAEVGRISETHLPTNTGYKKFMPDDPLVVHWFDPQSFTRLVRRYVAEGDDLPLGQFILKFRGFSSRAKAAARALVPDARKLSDLTDSDVVDLLVGMRGAVKAPSHKVLGDPLGEKHMVRALRRMYCAEENKRAWYSKPIKTTLNGPPAVVEEEAVLEVRAEQIRGTPLFVGINHSPTYADPFGEIHLSAPPTTCRWRAGAFGGFSAAPWFSPTTPASTVAARTSPPCTSSRRRPRPPTTPRRALASTTTSSRTSSRRCGA